MPLRNAGASRALTLARLPRSPVSVSISLSPGFEEEEAFLALEFACEVVPPTTPPTLSEASPPAPSCPSLEHALQWCKAADDATRARTARVASRRDDFPPSSSSSSSSSFFVYFVRKNTAIQNLRVAN